MSALLLAGCGGGQEAAPQAPALPQALAEALATQADEIAASYEAGAVCEAAQRADALNDATVAAINRGQVPAAMQEELQSTVNFLVNEINCPPRPPPQEEDECEELGNQKKALEERIKETEDEEEKKALEEGKKALEERIKECKEERED